ncbi:MAG: hypothetical protein ACLQUY_04870 [Ktedonobacterales bacterium]
MIGVLTQIVLRQVCARTGRMPDASDPPPPRFPATKETASASRARRRAAATAPDTATGQISEWPDPVARTLVLLFTALAQRCVRAAPAQEEEMHE